MFIYFKKLWLVKLSNFENNDLYIWVIIERYNFDEEIKRFYDIKFEDNDLYISVIIERYNFDQEIKDFMILIVDNFKEMIYE